MKKPLFRFLFAVLLTVFCAAQSVTAQQPTATAQSQSSAQDQPQSPTATGEPSGSLAKASNEAAGKDESRDENAQFKRSASVQWMAQALHVSAGTAYLISVLLNFAVVVALLTLGFKKIVPGLLRSRSEAIQKELEEARRASADANQRLGAIEETLSKLGTEISALEAEATAQSKAEEARLKASFDVEQARIVHGAEQEIAAAAASARRELRNYAAELAVNLAEKKIHVDSATDQELVRDFVDQLGRNGE